MQSFGMTAFQTTEGLPSAHRRTTAFLSYENAEFASHRNRALPRSEPSGSFACEPGSERLESRSPKEGEKMPTRTSSAVLFLALFFGSAGICADGIDSGLVSLRGERGIVLRTGELLR